MSCYLWLVMLTIFPTAVANGSSETLSPEDLFSSASLVAVIEIKDIKEYQGGGGGIYSPAIVSRGKCQIVEVVKDKEMFLGSLKDYPKDETLVITSVRYPNVSAIDTPIEEGKFIAFLCWEIDGSLPRTPGDPRYLAVMPVSRSLWKIENDKLVWKEGSKNEAVSVSEAVARLRKMVTKQ